jgi:hypothetical protein
LPRGVCDRNAGVESIFHDIVSHSEVFMSRLGERSITNRAACDGGDTR